MLLPQLDREREAYGIKEVLSLYEQIKMKVKLSNKLCNMQ